MNQVILAGRLVYEPELKQTQSGSVILTTRLAVSRNDKDKTTDFINVHIFNKTAEFVVKYFHKGDPIGVIGKLQVSNWEKPDGTKMTDVYVMVNEVTFLPNKTTREGDTMASQAPGRPSELPFEL